MEFFSLRYFDFYVFITNTNVCIVCILDCGTNDIYKLKDSNTHESKNACSSMNKMNKNKKNGNL